MLGATRKRTKTHGSCHGGNQQADLEGNIEGIVDLLGIVDCFFDLGTLIWRKTLQHCCFKLIVGVKAMRLHHIVDKILEICGDGGVVVEFALDSGLHVDDVINHLLTSSGEHLVLGIEKIDALRYMSAHARSFKYEMVLSYPHGDDDDDDDDDKTVEVMCDDRLQSASDYVYLEVSWGDSSCLMMSMREVVQGLKCYVPGTRLSGSRTLRYNDTTVDGVVTLHIREIWLYVHTREYGIQGCIVVLQWFKCQPLRLFWMDCSLLHCIYEIWLYVHIPLALAPRKVL